MGKIGDIVVLLFIDIKSTLFLVSFNSGSTHVVQRVGFWQLHSLFESTSSVWVELSTISGDT